MKAKSWPYRTLLLVAAIVAIFTARTLLAVNHTVPNLFDLFNSLTVAGAFIIWLQGYCSLKPGDWITAFVLGTLVGVSMLFTTLFTPYPFFNIVRSSAGQAVVRGLFTLVAALGGLVIMRQGGPIQFPAANGNWKSTGLGILWGLAVGLPLAILNIFALKFTEAQAIIWQNPLSALLDALQPGIVEEVIYRFALWGLLWLLLRKTIPDRAVSLGGLLAMFVHTYSHFDTLFVQAPLAALGMGFVLALLWGLPPFILARRRGLESAIAFHWIQDAARFFAGY